MINAGYTRQWVGSALGIIENDFLRRGSDVLISEEEDMPDGFLIYLRADLVLLPFPP